MKKSTIATLIAASLMAGAAHAEVGIVTFGHQFGWAYAPMYVMKDQGLVEKHAKKLGMNRPGFTRHSSAG